MGVIAYEADAKVYPMAIREAIQESGLPKNLFPDACPWTFGQVMDPEFWPGDGT